MAEITITGSPEYQDSIKPLLKAIETNAVGKVILRAIENTGKDKVLTIGPYTKGNDAIGYCNALTTARDPAAAYPKGVRPDPNVTAPAIRGAFIGRDDDLFTRDRDERYDQQPAGFIGTGAGSSADIEFSPENWGASPKSCYAGFPAALPDEVLFHEIVHGLRDLQGVRNPWPTEDKDYGNDEEYLAIVTTNVYISAKPSTQLRANADGHWPLKPPLNTSAGFLSDGRNLRLLNIYQLAWRPTFFELAQVSAASFNPFRELWSQISYLYN